MTAVALHTRPADVRRTLRDAYRRLTGVATGWKVAVGLLGPLCAVAICLVTKLPPVVGLLVWLLGVSVVSDLLWRRIFNWITGPALLLVGLSTSFGLPHWQTSLAGFGVCLGLMLFLWFAFRGGEGDVKLIAVLGAVLGPVGGVEVAAGGYLLAAVVALGILACRLVNRVVTGRRSEKRFTAGTLPMAPFFALAAVLLHPTLGGV